MGTGLQLPGRPTAVAMAPNASAMYAATTSQFIEIDPTSRQVIRTIPGIPAIPTHVGFDPDPMVNTAFVVNGRQLSLFDLRTAKATGTLTGDGDVVDAVSATADD